MHNLVQRLYGELVVHTSQGWECRCCHFFSATEPKHTSDCTLAALYVSAGGKCTILAHAKRPGELSPKEVRETIGGSGALMRFDSERRAFVRLSDEQMAEAVFPAGLWWVPQVLQESMLRSGATLEES